MIPSSWVIQELPAGYWPLVPAQSNPAFILGQEGLNPKEAERENIIREEIVPRELGNDFNPSV